MTVGRKEPMSKKDREKALDAGKKKSKTLPVEIEQMATRWDDLAAESDDPVAAACYREQAGSVSRLATMERDSLRLTVEDLEREVRG